MRTVGIIGGMGPETTAEFYLHVVFKVFSKNKAQRPPILIWNIPLKYDVEQNFIESGKGIQKYLPHLVTAAKNLEKGGADFIVIPCNSVHVFIDRIRKEVKIPVLSIVDETKAFLKNKKFKNIGVLATTSTINQKLYEGIMNSLGVKIVKPNEADQARLGKIINRLVTKRYADREKAQLLKIIWAFGKKNIDALALACTDLQLVINPKEMPVRVFDTMELLVDATVREVLRKRN
jgi:aspartate racemase